MKNLFLLLIIISFQFASSQSWQWAKRGGAVESCNNGDRQEEVSSIITDSNKNVYIVSFVTRTDLNVDGNPKTNWGDSNTLRDVMIASFACDGSYRWSKVIGGSNSFESINNLQIDAQNNIYFSGRMSGNLDFNARIDNDYTIVENFTIENNSKIFIAKYSSTGQMQWIRRPQADNVSGTNGLTFTNSVGLSIDLQGNSQWFVRLPVGSYVNGQYNVTTAGLYILRYNASGIFVSGSAFDIIFGAISNWNSIRIYKNPINGNLYFTGERYFGANTELTIGGQAVNNSHFLACFNAAGTFLWKRESNNTEELWIHPYGLAFDQDNNIYIGGTFFQYGTVPKSYLGYSPAAFGNRQFIMKLNPDASQILWSTNSNVGGLEQGGIAYNPFTNQIGLTTWAGGDYTWGNLTVNVNTFGVSGDVVLCRFNKNTGVCTNIDKIAGNPDYPDNGTALTVDASGDYLVGGRFGSQLYPNATTTLTSVGGQSDFFVAKFATQACSSLATNSFDKTKMQIYPNPTTGSVTIGVLETTSFEVLDVLGKVLQKGSVSVNQNTIDLSKLRKGVYFLRIDGKVSKVVKE